MIDLTIKTLDSQNHAFSVEDEITVAQFKEKISEVINIPVESQRLIYCGRVLQDNKKLQEYNVNGKVVHLVQRAPPSASRRVRSPPPTGNGNIPRGRGFSNTMYLGSMAFPSNIMESQGHVRPPPTQSLSGSRLAVARRMLRRAEGILTTLEGGTRSRESPPEDPQDDVTPVFAAQVFVPNGNSEQTLAASLSAAVTAVENGILEAEAMQSDTVTETDTATDETEIVDVGTETDAAKPETAATNTAEKTETDNNTEESATDGEQEAGAATTTTTTEETSDTNQEAAGTSETSSDRHGARRSRTRGLSRNSYGTIEMSRLLDDLSKINERLQPYMERYHTFMRTDPAVAGEQETRETQLLVNRVSEIMHLLGHAYHSLSDVMVQVSTPTPRPLLCRPILIQHSAVLQAGIPIQVEAQINLAPDRRASDNNPNQTGTQTENQTSATSATNDSNAATTNTNGNDATVTSGTEPVPPQTSAPTPQARANVREIRIDSFPFDFRGFPRTPVFNFSSQARPQEQENAQFQAPQPATGNNDTGTTQATETPDSGTENNTTAGQQQEPYVAVVPPFTNNPNMEFFMEVTPESITIDSLETTVVTSAAQADNVLHRTFGGVPPEFIQSLVLHAIGGDMMGTSGTSTPTTTNGNTTTFEFSTETPSSDSNQASTAATTTNANGSNVNSQARGNTQTHPTTSTQTRSTARPHEHLAQHTMQGFDPFLPCNSHHIHRRRVPVSATTVVSASPASNAENATANGEQQNNNQLPQPLYNILQGLRRSFGNVNRPQQQQQQPQRDSTETTSTTTTTESTPAPSAPPQPTETEGMSLTLDLSDLASLLIDNRTPGQIGTLDTLLQNFPDDQYNEGESIFTDLIMTLARGLTFSDVIALNSGRMDPLLRIRPALRTFFSSRVLESECPTQADINRGSNRLISELQPILEIMSTMRVRDNIDIVQSATQLCRIRFPIIISALMSGTSGSLRILVDQCIVTIRLFCALALHSCADGQAGVEEVFRTLVSRYAVGISSDLYQWTIATSVSQLRHFLQTIDIPSDVIERYIVLKSSSSTNVANNVPEPNQTVEEAETMECEEAPVVEATPEPNFNIPPILEETAEPLPNVVIGSESWHRGLSSDWIPIITRDTQRQRRQNPQPPFSDAYLSGMPSKRRKIVANSKPQTSVSQGISDGIRRAVTASGVTNTVPLDVVSQAASSDSSVRAAYRDHLRNHVRSDLSDNPEFTSERFPNAALFFNMDK